jgi:outer membrane receptor for ferrienterochelin and colicin
MTIGKHFGVLSLAAAMMLAASGAQAEGRIQQRRENQQARIAGGIVSGQLTPRESARLERGEARLNGEIRDMREDNGGKLTPRDRRVVNRQQNDLSRRIYRQKHDGQKQ